MLGKPTIRMPTAIDPSIVKIAVELENHTAQLIEFDQKNPLSAIIRSLCQNWNVNDDENYALQFCEPNNRNYVTEKNRNEVKNGSVLRLRHSPAKTANDILEILKTGVNTEKSRVLEQLSQLSSDLTFAMEFKEQGMNIIIAMIENEQCIGEMLKYVMLSFVELMEHAIISWDILQSKFIVRNIKFISHPSTVPQEVVQCALSTLENIVQNSSKFASVVENDVTLENLLVLLGDTTSQIIKQNTIALINALFVKGDDDKKREIARMLSTKRFRSAIIETIKSANIGISHQLYVLQTLTLNLLEGRMMTQLNAQDQDANDKIKELRRIAFDESVYGDAQSDVQSRRHHSNGNAGFYKKLGFKCDINPAQDFIETPPGMLALDCMVYFARNHAQQYTKVVHENSCRADEHECPFGRTSIELVKLICEILHIGESPTEQGQDFHPMFFSHDHPFEEFFCNCVVILNKTWKDMRATSEDFAKVFSVVREQIQRSLKSKPNSLEDFKTKIQTLTYATITTLRQQERASKEECESTATAIVSLKEKISPEIISLIRAQRLGFLVEGTRFYKYAHGVRSKDKYWYARLSPNHKVIHYGDCDEKSVPTLEELCQKIQVCEMKQLLVGKECPHMNLRRKSAANFAFSITIDNMDNQTLDFVAPDEISFNYWTDAINALLDLPMCSKQKEEDFETLLSMEIKLRLLDAEGVDISQEPPPIPDEPLNYDFCFES